MIAWPKQRPKSAFGWWVWQFDFAEAWSVGVFEQDRVQRTLRWAAKLQIVSRLFLAHAPNRSRILNQFGDIAGNVGTHGF